MPNFGSPDEFEARSGVRLSEVYNHRIILRTPDHAMLHTLLKNIARASVYPAASSDDVVVLSDDLLFPSSDYPVVVLFGRLQFRIPRVLP